MTAHRLKHGAIALLQVIGWGVAIAGIALGFENNRIGNAEEVNIAQGQEIATVKVKTEQTQQDIKDIKADVKEILRVIGGRPSGQVKGIMFNTDNEIISN